MEPFTRLSVVPFNHIGHETYNNTLPGLPPFIDRRLRQVPTLPGPRTASSSTSGPAMHRVSAQASCMGCHDAFRRTSAARLSRIDAAQDWPELAGCVSCHHAKPTRMTPQTEPKAMAAMLLEARNRWIPTYSDEDSPGDGGNQDLSKQVEPAKLPHRRSSRRW